MTTTVKKGETVNGVVRYYLISELEVDSNNMGVLVLDRSAFMAIGLNRNMSPVSGSELLTINYTHLTGPNAGSSGQDYIFDASHKEAEGYAFEFLIENSNRGYKITMAYQAVAQTPGLTVVDAYGYAGYWRGTIELTGITFGLQDISLTFSPQKELIRANDTHAQLFI